MNAKVSGPRSVGRALLALALLLGAMAVPPPTSARPDASISIIPTSGPPGSQALVTGSFPDYGPYDFVTLWWDTLFQGRYLGSVSLRSDHTFAIDVIIPPEASAGSHQVIADVNYGYEQSSTPFDVSAANRSAAYIYNADSTTANDFKNLLEGNGVSTTLVQLDNVAGSDFSGFDVILAGPDSGYGSQWGTTAAVNQVRNSGKPVLGLGDGGYALFGQLNLDIGWPHGWHGTDTQLYAFDPQHPVYNKPYDISVPYDRVLDLFSIGSSYTAIHLPTPPDDVILLGREVGDQTHYLLVEQANRYLFWGYDGPPESMTSTGKDLFVNVVWYMIRAVQVDTLILTDYDRMEDLGYSHADVVALENDINNLIGLPSSTTNMTAVHKDLSDDAPSEVQTARTTWDSNENSVANTDGYVTAIDNYIESLKQGSYPNLQYVILVGAHEVIPMKARDTDDMDTPYRESEWADDLPQTSGYFYSLYHDPGANNFGHYLTDSVYGDLSYIDNGYGADNELIPELAVGRLVETPSQISTLLQNYIASNGTLSRNNMAAIGSWDYKDGAQQAADHMGATADTALIQDGFTSSQVPPKINAHDHIVYIGGHGDYNWMTTRRWDQGFMAGHTAAQGDTEELGNLPDAVIVASGCHNGVNFGNKLYHDYTGNTDYGEFPERFANKEVGIYLGSTGYTWISGSGSSSNAANTGWSEKLATHFVNHLLNDGMWTTAGQAYKAAVNEYVSDYGGVGNPHRRVLAIATLYGIPNYHWPRLLVVIAWQPIGYWLQARWVAWPPLLDVQGMATVTETVTLEITDWTVDLDGLIDIPAASYTGDHDEPILPIVNNSHVLPTNSNIVNITLNQAESLSTTISNDVPLANMAVLTTTVPNTFSYAGFYPPTPVYTTTLTTLGGGAAETGLTVVPVQYDQSTHQTRIWTRMAFDIEYEVDAYALGMDSDGDGLPDYWESGYGLNPNDASGDQGASGDPDEDGLTNTQEYDLGTNPLDPDTDHDSWSDGAEVSWGTDPLNPGSWPSGSITVYKVVEGDGGAAASDWSFTINPDPNSVGAQTGPTAVFRDLPPDTYTISEDGPEGFSLVISGDCDSSGEVTVGPGESKACTFTNTANMLYLPLILKNH